MKITRSYSRKIQDQSIGGNKYETSEFFIAIEEEFDGSGEKFIQEKSAYLDALCRAEVGKSIGERTKELEEDKPEPQKKINFGEIEGDEEDDSDIPF